jgi:sirohydrochlorin cobaltochelatase
MHPSVASVGCLIVGHGTRNVAGLQEFQALCLAITARIPCPSVACFLELAKPTIAQGIAELASQGVKEVVIVPLLLFSAGHAKQDVPDAVLAAAKEFGITIRSQTAPLECQHHLLALSCQRVQAVLPSEETTPSSSHVSHVLLVGRGSSDPLAIQEVNRYAKALADRLQLPATTAFVAVARPLIREALRTFVGGNIERVIVLPHLLFRGEVLETIHHAVQEIALEHPHRQWLLAEHLGSDAGVVAAILARIREVEPDLLPLDDFT